MMVIVAYDRDYLRDPERVNKMIEIHDNFKNIINDYEKPQGKRILTPVIINFLSHLYGKEVSFVKTFKKTDRFFLFMVFIGFHLLLLKLGYDLKSVLIATVALAYYLMYGFVKLLPIFRFSDISNLMFFIWGLYFLIANYKFAFLVNLFFMTFNRETSILLVLILIILTLLNNESKIRSLNFRGIKQDFSYVIISIFIYSAVQTFLDKIICKSNLNWGGFGFFGAMLFYSKMNFTSTGFRYFFNWFNFLIILSAWGFFKKSNFIKASIFVIFLYILSVYLIGGVFGEGEGLLLPVAPVLILGAMEELKKLKIL